MTYKVENTIAKRCELLKRIRFRFPKLINAMYISRKFELGEAYTEKVNMKILLKCFADVNINEVKINILQATVEGYFYMPHCTSISDLDYDTVEICNDHIMIKNVPINTKSVTLYLEYIQFFDTVAKFKNRKFFRIIYR